MPLALSALLSGHGENEHLHVCIIWHTYVFVHLGTVVDYHRNYYDPYTSKPTTSDVCAPILRRYNRITWFLLLLHYYHCTRLYVHVFATIYCHFLFSYRMSFVELGCTRWGHPVACNVVGPVIQLWNFPSIYNINLNTKDFCIRSNVQ